MTATAATGINPHGDPEFTWHVYLNGVWQGSARTSEGMFALGSVLRASWPDARVTYRRSALAAVSPISQEG